MTRTPRRKTKGPATSHSAGKPCISDNKAPIPQSSPSLESGTSGSLSFYYTLLLVSDIAGEAVLHQDSDNLESAVLEAIKHSKNNPSHNIILWWYDNNRVYNIRAYRNGLPQEKAAGDYKP